VSRATTQIWPVGFVRAIPLTVLAVVILCACGRTVPGNAVRATASPSAVVQVGALDPGRYPTTPSPALGTAGSDEVGRLIEGRRMARYVVGPWQVDATLTHGQRTGALVINDRKQLGAILWPDVIAPARRQPFIVAFSSERRAANPKDPTMLRNAVLRFASANAATAAAQGISSAAMKTPTAGNADSQRPVGPVRPVPIPGHPDINGALATHRIGDQNVQEVTVVSAHGPYALIQVADSAQGPDQAAAVAGRALDLQLPLIDQFQPTEPAQLADLPLDPTGLVARTLPLKPGQADSMSNAAYDAAAELHLEDDPIQADRAFAESGVDVVSMSQTTVYQAKNSQSAQRLAQVLGDDAARRPASHSGRAVPGLPQSRCIRLDEENGLVPRYWCIAAVDRYTIKSVARQIDNAHQQVAAQYLILSR
jgi:hypothetical protein